jgi:hypothetical protein
MSYLYKLLNFHHKWMKYKIIRIVTCLLQPVLSYCHPSLSRGVLCFQWWGSSNCFVCWYSRSGLRCINFVHANYCIQISHQLYVSTVIHPVLLNNVRKEGRLILSRTSSFCEFSLQCYLANKKCTIMHFFGEDPQTFCILQGSVKIVWESLIHMKGTLNSSLRNCLWKL